MFNQGCSGYWCLAKGSTKWKSRVRGNGQFEKGGPRYGLLVCFVCFVVIYKIYRKDFGTYYNILIGLARIEETFWIDMLAVRIPCYR